MSLPYDRSHRRHPDSVPGPGVCPRGQPDAGGFPLRPLRPPAFPLHHRHSGGAFGPVANLQARPQPHLAPPALLAGAGSGAPEPGGLRLPGGSAGLYPHHHPRDDPALGFVWGALVAGAFGGAGLYPGGLLPVHRRPGCNPAGGPDFRIGAAYGHPASASKRFWSGPGALQPAPGGAGLPGGYADRGAARDRTDERGCSSNPCYRYTN